jgi:hypothetical protein
MGGWLCVAGAEKLCARGAGPADSFGRSTSSWGASMTRRGPGFVVLYRWKLCPERGIAFYRKQGFKALRLHLVGAGAHAHRDIVMSCLVH